MLNPYLVLLMPAACVLAVPTRAKLIDAACMYSQESGPPTTHRRVVLVDKVILNCRQVQATAPGGSTTIQTGVTTEASARQQTAMLPSRSLYIASGLTENNGDGTLADTSATDDDESVCEPAPQHACTRPPRSARLICCRTARCSLVLAQELGLPHIHISVCASCIARPRLLTLLMSTW